MIYINKGTIKYYLGYLFAIYKDCIEDLPELTLEGHFEDITNMKGHARYFHELKELKISLMYLQEETDLDTLNDFMSNRGMDHEEYELRKVIEFALQTDWSEVGELPPDIHKNISFVNISWDEWKTLKNKSKDELITESPNNQKLSPNLQEENIEIPLNNMNILSPEPLKLLSPSSPYKLPPEITQIEVNEEIKDKGQILTATLFSYYLENEQQVPYKVENIKIQLTSINKSNKLYTFENMEPFMVIWSEKAQHFPKNMKIIINQNNVKVAP